MADPYVGGRSRGGDAGHGRAGSRSPRREAAHSTRRRLPLPGDRRPHTPVHDRAAAPPDRTAVTGDGSSGIRPTTHSHSSRSPGGTFADRLNLEPSPFYRRMLHAELDAMIRECHACSTQAYQKADLASQNAVEAMSLACRAGLASYKAAAILNILRPSDAPAPPWPVPPMTRPTPGPFTGP